MPLLLVDLDSRLTRVTPPFWPRTVHWMPRPENLDLLMSLVVTRPVTGWTVRQVVPVQSV